MTFSWMLFLSEEYLFRDTSLDVCAAFASISREPLDRTICLFVMDAVTEGVNSSTMISSSTASSPLYFYSSDSCDEIVVCTVAFEG